MAEVCRTEHDNKAGSIFRINSKQDAMHMCSMPELLGKDYFEPKEDLRSDVNGFERLKSELARLRTFIDSSWPTNVPVCKEELAKAGWFYTGLRDRVQCPWCQGAVYNWEEGDTGFGEHKKHFPSCPFVRDNLQNECRRIDEEKREFNSKKVEELHWSKLPPVKAVLVLGYDLKLVESVVNKLMKRGIRSEYLLISVVNYK